MRFFSSMFSVFLFAAWSKMVDRRSSCLICVGSTFDSWRMVIPKQMTMKPMTRVMILVAEALRPLNSTIVVMMEKNVTKGNSR